MRKAPKRGHRVRNRTAKYLGLSASRGLLALDRLRHTLSLESHGANAVCAIGGFRAILRYNRSIVPARPLHAGLTLPFFHDSSPGPGGAFLKENYPIPNTHETAEPCGCSPAEPVVNGVTISAVAGGTWHGHPFGFALKAGSARESGPSAGCRCHGTAWRRHHQPVCAKQTKSRQRNRWGKPHPTGAVTVRNKPNSTGRIGPRRAKRAIQSQTWEDWGMWAKAANVCGTASARSGTRKTPHCGGAAGLSCETKPIPGDRST